MYRALREFSNSGLFVLVSPLLTKIEKRQIRNGRGSNATQIRQNFKLSFSQTVKALCQALPSVTRHWVCHSHPPFYIDVCTLAFHSSLSRAPPRCSLNWIISPELSRFEGGEDVTVWPPIHSRSTHFSFAARSRVGINMLLCFSLALRFCFFCTSPYKRIRYSTTTNQLILYSSFIKRA